MGGRPRISSRSHSPPGNTGTFEGRRQSAWSPPGPAGQLRIGARSPTGMGVQAVPGGGRSCSQGLGGLPSQQGSPGPGSSAGAPAGSQDVRGLFFSGCISALFLLVL